MTPDEERKRLRDAFLARGGTVKTDGSIAKDDGRVEARVGREIGQTSTGGYVFKIGITGESMSRPRFIVTTLEQSLVLEVGSVCRFSTDSLNAPFPFKGLNANQRVTLRMTSIPEIITPAPKKADPGTDTAKPKDP